MIKITFKAASVSELRATITEYLSVPVPQIPKEEQPKKKKATDLPKEEPAAAEQVEAPSVSIEDVRALVLGGVIPKAKVKELLGKYKAERITNVPAADLAAFHEELSALKGE